MKIYLMSDLHIEFDYPNEYRLSGEYDPHSVLILSGDIAPIAEYTSVLEDFLLHVSSIFEHVVYVPGNHEFYGGDIEADITTAESICSKISNVKFLYNRCFILGDYIFIGTPMWTSLDNNDYITGFVCKNSMNDFEVIRYNGDLLHPSLYADLHYGCLTFIKDKVRQYSNKKAIVVTHHAPSFLSIHERFRDSKTRYAYFEELGNYIADNENIVLWTHGHVHDSLDYMIHKTRIVCNPRGYVGEILNKDFKESLEILL